jgi:signal transduction histidine kinase
MTSIDADQLVRDLAEARALGRAKELEVESAIPQAPVVVRGDRERRHQALLILIDNACRYTPHGGRISLDLTADATHMVLTVADTGVGIARDELDRVTERFYRGSGGGALEPSGAGLGLHIAKSLIEGHGGALSIASDPGAGTRVTVRLPLRQDDADECAAG